MRIADMIDVEVERARGDGRMERVITFTNRRRVRVYLDGDGHTVQLLDCRNDEHENRLFKMRVGLDDAGVDDALAAVAVLPPPTRHKYDR